MIQPLYTLFVLVFYQLPGQHPSVVVAAQIALNLMGFVLVVRTAELIYGRDHVSRILPLILLCDFTIWIFAVYIINEALFIFISICNVYFLVKALGTGRSRDYLATGVLAALGLLTRPAGIGFICAISLIMIAGRTRIRRPLAGWLIMHGAMAALCLPWMLRNYVSMDKLTPLSSEDRYHLLYASLPDSTIEKKAYTEFDPITTEPDEVADSLDVMGVALRNITQEPLSFVLRGLKRIATVWFHFPGTREWTDWRLKIPSLLIQWGFLLFTLIGFLNTRWPANIALLAPAIGISALLFFTYATTRFTVPALPAMLILTARGLMHVVGRIGLRS
jgi:4-amino-4-deoxy-L-arabinose transferase-like glycosyltransferase